MNRSYQLSRDKTANCDSTCGMKKLSPRVQKTPESTYVVKKLSPRLQSSNMPQDLIVEKKIAPKVVNVRKISPTIIRYW